MPPFACVSMANVLCILKSVNFLNIGFDWGEMDILTMTIYMVQHYSIVGILMDIMVENG